jgi:hypothetical protein
MRRYDDPVEVRRGVVAASTGPVEAPEQFLWRGGLWKVVDVVAHWVETGPWWQSAGVAALLGDEPATQDAATTSDLLAEREVWRVEAGRGAVHAVGGHGAHERRGVFELAFDWAQGGWLLTRCAD